MTTVTLKFFDFKSHFENNLKKVFDQTTFPIQTKDNSNGITQLNIEMSTQNLSDLEEVANSEDFPNVAFVSPANSFGWMSGGIDYPLADEVLPGIDKTLQNMLKTLNYKGDLEKGYSKEFIDQMLDSIKTICQIDENLSSKVLAILKKDDSTITKENMIDHVTPEFINKNFPRETPEYHLPVGSAILVHHQDKNQFLISAPTMFFPQDVRNTRNPYFAMIAILKVTDKYNLAHPEEPITTILCPGLGTGVGGMSFSKLSNQIHEAVLDFQKGIQDPDTLDQTLVQKLENVHPDLLYLRESAFHQQPLKANMVTYHLKSMFGSGNNPNSTKSTLLEEQFEAFTFS